MSVRFFDLLSLLGVICIIVCPHGFAAEVQFVFLFSQLSEEAGFKPQAEVKGLCGACMRNRRTPAGFKPKPAKTIPRKTL